MNRSLGALEVLLINWMLLVDKNSVADKNFVLGAHESPVFLVKEGFMDPKLPYI